MKPNFNLVLLLLLLVASHGQSQDADKRADKNEITIIRKQYQTLPTHHEAIRMDGLHDEPAWSTVEWSADFIQSEPNDGASPYQPTQFKILHDDKHLYLAYRAFDIAPDSIESRLSRRDEFAGDWVEVNIDSYHDLRTAFSFTLSVSGVKGDEFVSDNGNNWDTNWNPIWDAATHIDSLGWTAEVRIPFSQLRYGNQSSPVWGIQVMRRIFRKEERSTWQHIPKNGSGWVSRFGELHGLTNLPTNKQIELAPYISAQTERFEAEAGNPFADGTRSKISGGIDGKIALTRDLILDFTVNPDFGQVEADPGAVRLDGYEIFFGERRPFFMESRNLFDYRLTGSYAGGDYDSDLLFYSRRIGGNPHQYPNLSDGEFAEVPSFASIAGAAKFSGKTKNGLSIGILESITDREMATISNGSDEREEIVEPLTSYFAGRVLKDFDSGNTIVGGMITAVNRGSGVNQIAKDAYSGGVDFQHFWKNRWWSIKANINFSHISGSKEAILNTQTGFVHLLQRTDAEHLGVDPNRTSLTGTGGTIKLGKYGGTPDKRGGYYRFETGITWRSPHLELNDIGFLQAADEINHFGWGAYNLQQPFSIFRNANINYNQFGKWDFGGRLLYAAFNTNVNFHFNNNWRTGMGFTWNPYDVSNNALRGTTSLRKPPGFGIDGYIEGDSRKKIYANINLNGGHAYEKTVTFFGVNAGLVFQPINALRFSFSPGYAKTTRKQDQFVANRSFNGGTRSIVSNVSQRNFSLSTRVNYYITPELSIQYYGQPFIFRALYKNFGFVKDPLNKRYDDRFHAYTNDEIKINDRTASVDENGDGQTDYSFSTPDLNYIQFRSNLVVRWEYVAGSEIFLVWSQGVTPDAFGDLQTPLLQSLTDHVFDQQPHNIFLVKLSYRFLN